jgi:hypothetical protein
MVDTKLRHIADEIQSPETLSDKVADNLSAELEEAEQLRDSRLRAALHSVGLEPWEQTPAQSVGNSGDVQH